MSIGLRYQAAMSVPTPIPGPVAKYHLSCADTDGSSYWVDAVIGDSSIERLACIVCRMGRSELIDRIKSFPAPFPMDFTDDYLNRLPEERLRHILLAAMIGLRPQDHGR